MISFLTAASFCCGGGWRPGTIDAVMKALTQRGVEVTEDGVRLLKRPPRPVIG